MDHLFARIEQFTNGLLSLAEQDELLSGLHADKPRSVRLTILVEKIMIYDEKLREIAKRRPDALEEHLDKDVFLERALHLGGAGPRLPHAPRPEPPEGEGEEEGDFAGLAHLAQRNRKFFETLMAGLRRGATAPQLLYTRALEIRCTEVPRPSYREVAERLGVPEGTLRVGVLRLREKAQYLVLLLLHGGTGAELGEGALAELRHAWREGRLGDLESSLDALRAAHSEDPDWRLHAGAAAFLDGRTDEAALHWVFGRVVAKDAGARAKLLSNLGCVEHAAGRTDRACAHWVAAQRLDPGSPFPLLNLAMHFVETGFAFLWMWALKELAKLRGDAESRRVIDEFLAGCPVFGKISLTSAWRRGPAKWIRELGAEGTAPGAGFRLPGISRPNQDGAGARLPALLIRRAA